MRLLLVLESNTDRRILEGLGERADLTVLTRDERIAEFPADPAPRVIVGPSGRGAYVGWVARTLRREPHDALLVQGYFSAALGACLAGRRPTLFICNPMERYYRCRLLPDSDKPFRRHELLALQACARVNARLAGGYAVLSEHLAGVVRAHGTRAPVEIVPAYGVDPAVYHPPAEDRAVVRRQLGLPDDGPLLFSGSRLAAEKDAGTLLAALARLDPGVRLLSCGHDQDRLLDRARELGVADRVVAREMVDPGAQLARHYAACDLAVQASREEGLGFAVLEALACGVPVVATAVGGLRETIRDGVTGYGCPPGDPAALAGAIQAALDDPAEARRRADAGARMVAERYAPGPAFDRLLALAAGQR